ncbi:CpaF family protein [Pokkaliibacter sp. MBI-7]|uniref:CpaF family protein n=1 Tax=Pokkaliibacter sp. MBI-7 TaxID=3040600 RepID=UPI00244868BB|nr:CpaF family protein [Pokkaliibacter sp. MBI-7]MDH2433042.1 CpaF family protein [Pokkaliibacter sp. MBI-7]
MKNAPIEDTLRWPSRQLDLMEDDHRLSLKASLHRFIIDRLEEDDLLFEMDRHQMRPHVQGYVHTYLNEHNIDSLRADSARLVNELLDEIVGFGPLQTLLEDDQIDDILINGASQVYVERKGKLERIPLRFINDQHVLRVIRRMIAPLGRRIDESSPMVDARLADGSRINAIIPPLAIDGPCLSVRKFRKEALTAEYLVKQGSLSMAMQEFLARAARSRCNMLISGSTGSGKTTLLNILSQNIGQSERVVTIEDAAELQLLHGHVVRLETRPPNAEGLGEVTARDLVKNALRMRPDRIILGESRGAEVLDMLQAMNTGHQGSMSTLHANSARDALMRLELMVALSGFSATELLVKQIIASALDIIVFVSRMPDGRRVVTQVVEVLDVADGMIRIAELFHYDLLQLQFREVDKPSAKLLGRLKDQPQRDAS